MQIIVRIPRTHVRLERSHASIRCHDTPQILERLGFTCIQVDGERITATLPPRWYTKGEFIFDAQDTARIRVDLRSLGAFSGFDPITRFWQHGERRLLNNSWAQLNNFHPTLDLVCGIGVTIGVFGAEPNDSPLHKVEIDAILLGTINPNPVTFPVTGTIYIIKGAVPPDLPRYWDVEINDTLTANQLSDLAKEKDWIKEPALLE